MRLYPAFHVEALPRKIETALLGGPDRVRLVVGRVRIGRCDRRGRAGRQEQSRNTRAGNPGNRRVRLPHSLFAPGNHVAVLNGPVCLLIAVKKHSLNRNWIPRDEKVALR